MSSNAETLLLDILQAWMGSVEAEQLRTQGVALVIDALMKADLSEAVQRHGEGREGSKRPPQGPRQGSCPVCPLSCCPFLPFACCVVDLVVCYALYVVVVLLRHAHVHTHTHTHAHARMHPTQTR